MEFKSTSGDGVRDPLIRPYQLPPTWIGYLTSLFEGYEGIGLVRTLDRSRGIVELWIMPDYEEDFRFLMAAVSRQFPIQPLDKGFA